MHLSAMRCSSSDGAHHVEFVDRLCQVRETLLMLKVGHIMMISVVVIVIAIDVIGDSAIIVNRPLMVNHCIVV